MFNFKEFLYEAIEEELENLVDEESNTEKLAKDNDAKWITSGGHHYCVTKDGKIVSGKFKGSNMEDLRSTAKAYNRAQKKAAGKKTKKNLKLSGIEKQRSVN